VLVRHRCRALRQTECRARLPSAARRRLRVFVLNGPKIVDAASILVEMIPRMPTKVTASGTVAIWPLADPGT
jgi:hypothetical protein